MKVLWTIAAALVFLAYYAVEIPLMLVGAVLILIECDADLPLVESPKYPGRQVRRWWWDWMQYLWGNWQNGVDGAAGDDLPSGWPHTTWPLWAQRLVWSAWRNKVGNERWTPLLGMAVDPALVRVCYSSELPVNLTRGYFLVRQGWRFQLRFSWPGGKYQCRLGWGIAEETSKTELGIGFSTKPITAP